MRAENFINSELTTRMPETTTTKKREMGMVTVREKGRKDPNDA